MTTLQVFIGYDPRQPIAFQVAAHSVWKHLSKPVPITRLDLKTLPIKRRGLTEFTYSRFLVPWLSGYQGLSLFLDSDVLCLANLVELLMAPISEPECDVYVVKNARRFEWPSVMLFNNEWCKSLTPEFVDDTANGLFDLAWAQKIGELPAEWNHLSNYDPARKDAKLVHFTQGVPVWPETKDSEYAEEWLKAFKETCSTVSFKELMGKSVHAAPVAERLKKTANGQ